RGVNISQGRIFPARNKHWKFLWRRGDNPAVARINLIKFLEPAFPQNLEEEFVRETALFFFRSGDPFVYDRSLDSANGFLFRDAGFGHPIQMTPQEFFLLLR